MVPVFAAIGLLVVGALVVAVMQNKKKNEEAAAAAQAAERAVVKEQTSNPFADRDNDPKARDGSKIGTQNTAPEGLAETKLWVDAKVLGDAGIALVKEATAALNQGDEETYRTKGIEARDKLDEALLQTGDWIIDLLANHPNDRQVDRLSRERGRWQDHIKKVRKIQ
ncbi:hypothetical protein Poly30_00180 [Planctomycetes bacterium Poly30]|uniref:Uncharacterized protein n=1 Tax=Saltatorellus ferox TaxID=2528018 RepID=A0A518EKA9_9BACT|nr:hypothetical protein Poly30_00180 [Planctomycetes bacterium Poly30]